MKSYVYETMMGLKRKATQPPGYASRSRKEEGETNSRIIQRRKDVIHVRIVNRSKDISTISAASGITIK
uniref:Uncharacterized protein n=1 Tax=Trichogramma kaykai TaxID=54128 RepID=A0ABD2W212_9HYME